MCFGVVVHDCKKSPTDECIGSARARYVEPLSPSLGQFGSWSSGVLGPLFKVSGSSLGSSCTAGGDVWSVSSYWTSRQTCFGSMSLSSFAVGISPLHLFTNKIKSLQYFTVTLWSEVVWTCLNQTWTTKGQPCGRILPQERFWHNVWRNLSFPVTWRRQLHFPGTLFPPHEVEKLSLPSHQENLNWLDRNDRNCLQSQTSLIQLVVSRGFYAVWFIFLITTYHC